MAVIKTIRAKNGALIEVDDECIRDVPEEEMRERKQRIIDAAKEILISSELRRRAAEHEVHENDKD